MTMGKEVTCYASIYWSLMLFIIYQPVCFGYRSKVLLQSSLPCPLEVTAEVLNKVAVIW